MTRHEAANPEDFRLTEKISAEDLLKKIYAPGARVEDFAPYFKIEPDAAGAFQLDVT